MTERKKGGARPGAGRKSAGTEQITIRLKTETASALRAAAEALQVGNSEIAEEAIAEHLANLARKKGGAS